MKEVVRRAAVELAGGINPDFVPEKPHCDIALVQLEACRAKDLSIGEASFPGEKIGTGIGTAHHETVRDCAALLVRQEAMKSQKAGLGGTRQDNVSRPPSV
jgi:hypothetical protein